MMTPERNTIKDTVLSLGTLGFAIAWVLHVVLLGWLGAAAGSAPQTTAAAMPTSDRATWAAAPARTQEIGIRRG